MNKTVKTLVLAVVVAAFGGSAFASDWCGFFNATKAEKTKALACAIKGVGPKLADCMMDNNIVTNKPDTWSDFKAMMKRADTYCPGVYANAVERYGSDNKSELYGSAAESYAKQSLKLNINYSSRSSAEADGRAIVKALANRGISADYSTTYNGLTITARTNWKLMQVEGKGYANKDRATQAVNDKGNYLESQGHKVVWYSYGYQRDLDNTFLILYLSK